MKDQELIKADGKIRLGIDDLISFALSRIDRGQSVEISPRGHSMRPFIVEGRDSVVLSKIETIKKYDILLYRRENGEYVLHRVIKCKDTFTFIGDNQLVCEKGIPRESILAVVSGVRRRDNLIARGSLKYRIYAIYYHRFRHLRAICVRIKQAVARLIGRNNHKGENKIS